MKLFSVLVNRANYARLFPVLKIMQEDLEIDNYLILSGTTLLDEYGNFSDENFLDQFHILQKIPCEDGGRSLVSMACTTANAIRSFSEFLTQNKPDMLLLIGDRYETLGVAIAASYLNIKIAHVQGGELSGSIDENIRHCITKLSHLHFPATEQARRNIIQMGENPQYVIRTGCPCGDYILNRETAYTLDILNRVQVNVDFDLQEEFILVSYHPVTTRIDEESKNITTLIEVVFEFGVNIIWTYPNSDPGSNAIRAALNQYKSLHNKVLKCSFITNIAPEEYLELINSASVCLGNSSSFVRDSSFLGTPVVLVGDRQTNREIAHNVVNVPIEHNSLMTALQYQYNHIRYASSKLYGDGSASEKIVKAIKDFTGSHIKTFCKS